MEGKQKAGAKEDAIYYIYIGVDRVDGETYQSVLSTEDKHPVLYTDSWMEYRDVYEALSNVIDKLYRSYKNQ